MSNFKIRIPIAWNPQLQILKLDVAGVLAMISWLARELSVAIIVSGSFASRALAHHRV
jgi:hypothetical protein